MVVACAAVAGVALAKELSQSPPLTVIHVAPHSRKGAGTGGLRPIYVMAAGRERNYLVYVPPGDSAKHRLPLVLVYSGVNDTAANTATETGLLALDQQKHDMIVAFLQGYDESWNDDAGNPPAEAAGVNDVAFSTVVLKRIESDYYVATSRVVATGFSNGAILVELLGCRIAADLTLIVPVEGQIANQFSNGCRPKLPISVYEVHATHDQEIPYGGGTFSGVGGPVTVLSAPKSAVRWATLDRCGATASTSTANGSVLTAYHGCKDGVTVTLNSIQGGAHQWPPGFAPGLVAVISSMSGKRTAVTP
jgi:polyhydroxybutyrate depolymerase